MRLRCLLSLSLACALANPSVFAAETDHRLADAAQRKDKAAIRLLLQQQVDLNAAQPDGATALHWAAYWDDVETVDLLLARRAGVNAANDYGATPLWVACAQRHTPIVQKLLAAGADPNKGLRSGERVLLRCVQTGDPAAVEALLARGAEVNATEPSRGQTALMWAAASRHSEVTRVLLAHGAAVDARTATVRQLRGSGKQNTTSAAGAIPFDAGGFTPLLFAARHADIDSARLLLDAGAKVNETAADGSTALVVAAMSGHGAFAAFLLDRGADPNASGTGYTALHAAVLRADPVLVKALLVKGANPNARLTKGTPIPRWTYQYVLTAREIGATPLALAAKYAEPEILRLLAAGGADPLIPMEDGTTPLMAATGLGANVDVDRRNRLIAPELIAAGWENEAVVLDTVKAAIEAGAAVSVNATNPTGDTALHGAARHRFKTVVELLVAQGGDMDSKNKKGVTPRQLLNPVRPTESESK